MKETGNTDFTAWRSVLGQPDWYLRLLTELKALQASIASEPPERQRELKDSVYEFFETEIAAGRVAFGMSGHDFDAERQPIDTAVIHHTANAPGITAERISVIHLLRLYATYYAHPYLESEQHIKGTPLYSGHFSDGKQVFYAYHWLVRQDGSTERLLEDREIGWHAGAWEVNCRSVGICLDGDYRSRRPSNIELRATARILRENYPKIVKERLLGHREVNPKTDCPSNLFLSTPKDRGWKEDLLTLL
ncbi:MAG: hypothetical protein COV10_00620 [Candidatus Vogelbacteria bacterium CG10_big_fil_rev_8_21_14_0_10_51_16]|uniref:N-acetylmuramoyl-L-alanine amidase n=1 Tax=Candidatus Vogelbacteria bacterium CG10_big_fil_rev_8_21_14_0_10_51_16 TaxID=1975045 RepID=A0A2H0RFL2_9BACT|nr:MAG: hypothetical protein COV10_00620 [Candidatus Vogelbacteria bacterium CG10_big_fil_rev_8_21_14_0_10_51_16]